MKQLVVAVFGFMMAGVAVGAETYTKNDIRLALKPLTDKNNKYSDEWIYATQANDTKVFFLRNSWNISYMFGEDYDLDSRIKTVEGWLKTVALDEKQIENVVFNNTVEHWNINCANNTYFIDSVEYYLDDELKSNEEYIRPTTKNEYMAKENFKFRYPAPKGIAINTIDIACSFEQPKEEIKKYLNEKYK